VAIDVLNRQGCRHHDRLHDEAAAGTEPEPAALTATIEQV
jgi:hypothetical protein